MDVEIQPGNPDIVYAWMSRIERKPWTIISGSREGGFYKSTDGGESFDHIMNGLPNELIGKANLPDVALRLGFRLQSKRGERHDAALFPVPGWIPEGGYSIDKALIFAFMRQESRFKTKAKSRRGASGLMQLMPATARFIATKQERRRGRRALFEPEFNIALGQKYIQKMLDEPTIGGNLFYAVTAYNAGPGTLRKWRRQVNYRDDPLLFIESIRSRETRDYVERVLTNFWTYRRRFDQDVPSLAAVAAGAWPVYIPLDPPPPTAKAN